MDEQLNRCDGEPCRILIVEDNRAIAETMQLMLHREGYATRWCQDDSLYDLVESWKPDLILMDIRMPRLDGGVATQRLKANPVTRSIPVIVVSSEQISSERLRSIRANDLVPKPFKISHLLDRVRYWISTRTGRLGTSMNNGWNPAV